MQIGADTAQQPAINGFLTWYMETIYHYYSVMG